jgi:DtxR family Mn-dependent transcriptional regulator
MSFISLAFSSDGTRALSDLVEGERGVVVDVHGADAALQARADRLLALGVTPGARITVLQTFPGVVFRCDQTELAVERSVAETVFVRPVENRS